MVLGIDDLIAATLEATVEKAVEIPEAAAEVEAKVAEGIESDFELLQPGEMTEDIDPDEFFEEANQIEDIIPRDGEGDGILKVPFPPDIILGMSDEATITGFPDAMDMDTPDMIFDLPEVDNSEVGDIRTDDWLEIDSEPITDSEYRTPGETGLGSEISESSDWCTDSEINKGIDDASENVDIYEIDESLEEKWENGRPLTETEAEKFKEESGWSDKHIDNIHVDEDGNWIMKTPNMGMEGQVHESGVPYKGTTIEVNGQKIECVMPDFDSIFEGELPNDLLEASREKHADYMNSQLKEALDEEKAAGGHELSDKLGQERVADIETGRTPTGTSWHHNEATGKMELVEQAQHDKTQGGAAHVGGYTIWGKGKSE